MSEQTIQPDWDAPTRMWVQAGSPERVSNELWQPMILAACAPLYAEIARLQQELDALKEKPDARMS